MAGRPKITKEESQEGVYEGSGNSRRRWIEEEFCSPRGQGTITNELLSVKKVYRGSCGLGEVVSYGEGHLSEQPAESRILEVAAASDGRFLGGENISSGSIDLPQITMGRAGRRVPGVAGNNRKHKTGKTQRKCSPSSMNVQTKVFAWARLERTNVPRFVMEHSNLIDLTFDRTSSPIEEMTNDHQSAKRIGIERQGVLMAKGRDDQKELKNPAARLQRMMEKVLADQRGRNVEIYLEEIIIKSKNKQDLVQDVEETQRKLKIVNNKINPVKSSFGVKEGGFLSYMVAKEGEGEILMLCLRQKDETISSVLLVEREGIQILVSYMSQPLQGMDICYTPMENIVQALVHTTRSLRAIFRKHKVKVITNGPMEEILKLSGKKDV
ncbi:hypothetical protein Tco_1265722 [Tanacetum coccineum]